MGVPLLPFSLFDDAFVAKLSPSGALLWHTFLGSGSDHAGGIGIAVDGAANVYVVGESFASWEPRCRP